MKKNCILFLLTFLSLPALFAQTVQDGLNAIDCEKYNYAKQIFSILISSSPFDAELNYYKGMVYYSMQQKDSAKAYFERGVKLNSAETKIAYNFVGLGKLALDKNNAAEAKINFDKAFMFSNSKDIKVYLFIADAYLNNAGTKDANQAIAVLTKSLALDKKNSDAYLLLGDAYVVQTDGGKAMSNYETAVELNPKSAKGYMKIGQLYAKARSYDGAKNAFQNCIKIDSMFVPVYRELAELHFTKKEYRDAKEAYKKYVSLAENNVSTLSRYASLLFLCKDYANTMSTINQIRQIDSSNVILDRLLGYASYEQGNYKQGLVSMKKFFARIDSQKIFSSDYEYLGKLYSKTGNDSLAIMYFNKAIAMDSTKAELHGDIAQLYTQKKKYNEAANEYELKAQQMQLTTQDYFSMGNAYYFGQNYSKADSAFAKVVELRPNVYLGYFWRGRASSNLDPDLKQGLAKPHYEKCVEIISVDSASIVKYKKELVESYWYLTNYYIQKEDDTNTKLFCKKVLEFDPEHKDAKKVIESLKQKR